MTCRDVQPYLMAVATSSNIGSSLTIIGNPQNLWLGDELLVSHGKIIAKINQNHVFLGIFGPKP